MKDSVQVKADDAGDIQVLNNRNCYMDKSNYLFYKFLNKIKSQDDIHRKVNGVIQREVEEQEIVEAPKKPKRSFLDGLTERVKDFLDNAE